MDMVFPFLEGTPSSSKGARHYGLFGRSSDLWTKIDPTGHRFPGLMSAKCLMMTFVSIHRCGTVPDSHRVPCFRAKMWRTKREYTIYGVLVLWSIPNIAFHGICE